MGPIALVPGLNHPMSANVSTAYFALALSILLAFKRACLYSDRMLIDYSYLLKWAARITRIFLYTRGIRLNIWVKGFLYTTSYAWSRAE